MPRMNTSVRGNEAAGQGRAFTLIEVLVVVAIIALLISILLPSLSRARDQARRAACLSNQHQQGIAMRSYGADNRGYAPWRGWFTYDISEFKQEAYGSGGTQKVLVNLGLLMGKHLSKNWDVLYCPSTITKYRDAPKGTLNGGLKTLYDNTVRFTFGGYNYALPMAKRTGAPRLEGDVYPRDVNMLDTNWVTVLKNKMPQYVNNNVLDLTKAAPRGTQPMVMDWVVGGAKGPHGTGLNSSYSDGHAKFTQTKLLDNMTSGSVNSFELWYEITRKQ